MRLPRGKTGLRLHDTPRGSTTVATMRLHQRGDAGRGGRGMVKACRLCGHDFEPTPRAIAHSDYRCRACKTARLRELRQAKPEQYLAKDRRWRAVHREYEIERAKRRRATKKEQIRRARRAWYARNKEHVAAREYKYRTSPKRQAVVRELIRLKYMRSKVDPVLGQKYRARRMVHDAIRRGLIQRQPCAVCGDPKSEGHHNDYSKPLDVIWLCRKHHREIHQEEAA